MLKKKSSHLVFHSPRVFEKSSWYSSTDYQELLPSCFSFASCSGETISIYLVLAPLVKHLRMSSLSILRFFFGPQSPETPQKSKKFSSSENRDRIRIIYNKIAYDRNAVIILLIKIRTNNVSLFDRISFKNVAVAKTLYFCLSNTKKIQYQTQAKQVIRSFLDQIKGFFNRWLSQFRAESAMNANFKLISQWSYRLRLNSWQKKRKIQDSSLSSSKLETRLFRSNLSEKYRRDSSENEKSRSQEWSNYYRSYQKKPHSREERDFYRFDLEERDYYHSNQDEPRHRFDQEKDQKKRDYYRSVREKREERYRNNSNQEKSRSREKRDYYRSDREKSRSMSQNPRPFVSREKRKLLTVSNDLSRSRSSWKDFISARSMYECSVGSEYEYSSRYSIFANESRVSQQFFVSSSRSSWKDLISARSSHNEIVDRDKSSRFEESQVSYRSRSDSFASESEIFSSRSFWNDLISARSKYDNNSRYCIQLLYLSENDLSEDDYDLLWIRFSKYLEFLKFLIIISSFSWRAGFFRFEELLWNRSFSERIRTDQNRPHLHIS